MYIDTHAHLNFRAFDLDWAETIQRAKKAKVEKIINVGSNFKTSFKALEIAQKSEGVFAAVGLHPIHVKEEEFNEEKFLKLAKNKKVVAIGETGLDYYYDQSTKDLQKEVFQKHLNLASRLSKPVILHSREANEDLLAALTGHRLLPRGVMHCFAGDWPMAKIVLEMGFYLSFTGLVTFSKNQKTIEVIKEAPLERILIETDCPYMTPAFAPPTGGATAGKPERYRGKRNEPAYVVEVAKKIAEIKKIPLEKVAEQTTKNARELFKLNKSF